MKALALILALCIAACAPVDRAGTAAEQWRSVAVHAVPLEVSATRLGRLVFRGGLDLQAHDSSFVGISGLEVMEDGSFVALGDEADWIEGRIVLNDAGDLVDVADVRTAWMRDEAGRPFRDKSEGDSEGLAQLPDGRFAVSFERTNLVRIYDLNRDGPFRAASRGPILADVERLPANAGFEALAATAAGALVTGAEGGERATTPIWLARLGAPAPTPPRFAYPLSDGFSLTGMDRLPDGGFVALERFYAPVIGARARITRFPADALAGEGGVIAVERLAELAPPFPIDNFEGISAVLTPDGGTRLYVVSDNNSSSRQRTLLLAFDIVD